MKTTLAFTLFIMIFSGCSTKTTTPEVRYVYKTKYEYIYIPCNDNSKNTKSNQDHKQSKKHASNKNRQSTLKTSKTGSSLKKEKFHLPKETTIFAPKRFITIDNKKMNYMVGVNPDNSRFIYLEGAFSDNTFREFKQFLSTVDDDITEIKINSNGGTVNSAMQLGAYIHDQGWSTGIDDEMRCYSACSFVFFAGKEKSLSGKALLGLHRPYLPGVKDTPQMIRKIKKEYISYWNYIGAPKSLYDEMMDVERDDLFLLNKYNINDYVDVEIN